MARKDKEPRKTKIRDYTRIEDGFLWFEESKQCALDHEDFGDILEYEKACRVVSLGDGWVERVWVSGSDSPVELHINIEMTLRAEMRSGKKYWYAYRKVGGIQFKRYVGSSDQINTRKLVEVARRMPG